MFLSYRRNLFLVGSSKSSLSLELFSFQNGPIRRRKSVAFPSSQALAKVKIRSKFRICRYYVSCLREGGLGAYEGYLTSIGVFIGATLSLKRFLFGTLRTVFPYICMG
jgi:hypothetical protein